MTPDAKIPIPHDVQEAIRTVIKWAGDDPQREGLEDTPQRVARAWREYCSGYSEDPAVHLSRVFEEVGGYDEIVLLKDIPFHKDPTQNIDWVTPEGGGGPNYPNM